MSWKIWLSRIFFSRERNQLQGGVPLPSQKWSRGNLLRELCSQQGSTMLWMIEYALAISPDEDSSSLLGLTAWVRTATATRRSTRNFGLHRLSEWVSDRAAGRKLAWESRTDSSSQNAAITSRNSTKVQLFYQGSNKLFHPSHGTQQHVLFSFCKRINRLSHFLKMNMAHFPHVWRVDECMNFVHRLKSHLNFLHVTDFGDLN